MDCKCSQHPIQWDRRVMAKRYGSLHCCRGLCFISHAPDRGRIYFRADLFRDQLKGLF